MFHRLHEDMMEGRHRSARHLGDERQAPSQAKLVHSSKPRTPNQG